MKDQCEAETLAEGRPCQRAAVEDREVAEIRRVCKVHAKASFVVFAATRGISTSRRNSDTAGELHRLHEEAVELRRAVPDAVRKPVPA